MAEVNIDNETLRKLQLTQKTILDEVVRVCEENDITYYLAYGTLLGAVRHKGFIPWDGDLDIWIKRDEYEKFVRIAPEKLLDGFCFINWDNQKEYGLCFGKVMKKGTVYTEQNAPDNNGWGIFIDIFPLDGIGEKAFNNKALTNRYFLLKRMLLAKCGYRVAKTFKAKLVMGVVKMQSMLYTKASLIKKIKKEEERLSLTGSEYLTTICGSAIGRTFTKKMKSEWFDSVVKLEFEGSMYSCPKNYKEVLTEEYGDYMQLPPEEKRHDHHGIMQLKF